jgi:hypothetical protein
MRNMNVSRGRYWTLIHTALGFSLMIFSWMLLNSSSLVGRQSKSLRGHQNTTALSSSIIETLFVRCVAWYMLQKRKEKVISYCVYAITIWWFPFMVRYKSDKSLRFFSAHCLDAGFSPQNLRFSPQWFNVKFVVCLLNLVFLQNHFSQYIHDHLLTHLVTPLLNIQKKVKSKAISVTDQGGP